eukprot:gene16266-16445_t
MSVEIYRPAYADHQTPHLQDELYVVISGSGFFVNNGERAAFQQGDVLFVPAGTDHRFENFTDDFLTWFLDEGWVIKDIIHSATAAANWTNITFVLEK